MDSDLLLVTGIILGVLSIPAMLNAYSDSRAPRLAAIVILIAGALIVVAVRMHPAGYTPAELPDVFARVFRNLFR